ncbi:urea ABC transporter substrate-binding protein [Myxococcota bacterium]|nr:urea ABC transporter substrate-binding protein [Myxococcota bacterium]
MPRCALISAACRMKLNWLPIWLLVAALGCSEPVEPGLQYDGEVKVGILHSRSGTMAISENTVAEAELLAINQINADGGLRVGERRLAVIPIEEDGESDWPTFAARAAELIDNDGVAAVFGGWTSASRKAMLPIFESRDHLLFYPIQYEGQECSRNVLYGGSVPNQQIEPALTWLFENRSRKLFLVGSDYVYPRTANAIINAQARRDDAKVVGEIYLPLGSSQVEPIVAAIKKALPSGGVIVNTLNGDSNVAFFKSLKQSGIDAEHGYSIISFSAAEEEVSAIGPEYLKGSLAVWNFFHTLDTPASQAFAQSFAEMHGLHRVTSDPAEAAYTMVMLWALAVEKAGTVEVGAVRDALVDTEFDGPAGRVKVQPNHHLSKRVLIGEVQSDGSFRIIEDKGVIAPKPWSTLIEESRGYHCNHSLDRPDADRFRPEDA